MIDVKYEAEIRHVFAHIMIAIERLADGCPRAAQMEIDGIKELVFWADESSQGIEDDLIRRENRDGAQEDDLQGEEEDDVSSEGKLQLQEEERNEVQGEEEVAVQAESDRILGVLVG